jgi:hypothetical protein
MTNSSSVSSTADVHGNTSKGIAEHTSDELRVGNAGLPPPPLGLRSTTGRPPRRVIPHKLAKPINQTRGTNSNPLDNQQSAVHDDPWLFQSSNFRPLSLPFALLSPEITSHGAASSTGDEELSLLVPLASTFALTTSSR